MYVNLVAFVVKSTGNVYVPGITNIPHSYSEAIETLYATNSFALSTDTELIITVDYFSHYFLPQRLALVRSLYFYWDLENMHYPALTLMPHPRFDEWVQTWNNLRKLTGLRRLHVKLGFRYGFPPDDFESFWKSNRLQFLAPVKTITAPADFVVTLPDPTCSTVGVDVGDSRCIFELPVSDETGFIDESI